MGLALAGEMDVTIYKELYINIHRSTRIDCTRESTLTGPLACHVPSKTPGFSAFKPSSLSQLYLGSFINKSLLPLMALNRSFDCCNQFLEQIFSASIAAGQAIKYWVMIVYTKLTLSLSQGEYFFCNIFANFSSRKFIINAYAHKKIRGWWYIKLYK